MMMFNSLVDIVIQAIKQAPLYEAEEIDREKIEELLVAYIDDEDKQGFVSFDSEGKPAGLLLAQLVQAHPMFHGKIFAAEVGWFNTGKGSSLNLLNDYEQWAREKGCDYITMSSFDNEIGNRLHKIYERKGYKRSEFSYLKNLNQKEK